MNDSDVGYVEMISQYLIKSCILDNTIINDNYSHNEPREQES